jgi:hypothetical protein
MCSNLAQSAENQIFADFKKSAVGIGQRFKKLLDKLALRHVILPKCNLGRAMNCAPDPCNMIQRGGAAF